MTCMEITTRREGTTCPSNHAPDHGGLGNSFETKAGRPGKPVLGQSVPFRPWAGTFKLPVPLGSDRIKKGFGR